MNDVQTVKKVFTEEARGNRFFQISVCRGYYPYIRLEVLVGADPAEFP